MPWGFGILVSSHGTRYGCRLLRPEELHGGDPSWKVDPVRSSPIRALAPHIELLLLNFLYFSCHLGDGEEGVLDLFVDFADPKRWGVRRLLLSSDGHVEWPLAVLGLARH
jgi:hypothetical protein